MDLVIEIYLQTKHFPDNEKFGLISQMRHCAVSIPSNIAEGSSRKSEKEFAQFLRISKGSLAELETQTIISPRLNFVDSKTANELIPKMEEISKMRSGLLKSISKN